MGKYSKPGQIDIKKVSQYKRPNLQHNNAQRKASAVVLSPAARSSLVQTQLVFSGSQLQTVTVNNDTNSY